MKLPANHICNTNITEICQPLFTVYNLTCIDYVRLYNDGTAFAFSCKPDLVKHFLNNEYEFVLPDNIISNNFFWLESSLLAPNAWQATIQNMREQFGIDHAIVLTEKNASSYELFYFYGEPNHSTIINEHLRYLDVLHQFKFIFREKANHLIKLATKQKLLLSKCMLPSVFPNKKTLPNANIKKIIFDDGYYITKSELKILKFIVMGYSMKETAELTNLSVRTVESYYNNAKLRLKCNKRSEMVGLLNKFKVGLLD